MSWGISTPCADCEKQSVCKVAQHIQEGINAAHQDYEGHKSGGIVELHCSNIILKPCPQAVEERPEEERAPLMMCSRG